MAGSCSTVKLGKKLTSGWILPNEYRYKKATRNPYLHSCWNEVVRGR